MERVSGYIKHVKGRIIHVSGYDRKSHDRTTPHDREVDRRNLRRARRAK